MRLLKPWQRINVLLSVCLIMLLSGCVQQPAPQVQYSTIDKPRLPIPSTLTSPLPVPAVPQNLTFGDSVRLSAELYGVIGQCNADRAVIRKIEEHR